MEQAKSFHRPDPDRRRLQELQEEQRAFAQNNTAQGVTPETPLPN